MFVFLKKHPNDSIKCIVTGTNHFYHQSAFCMLVEIFLVCLTHEENVAAARDISGII